MSDGCGAVAKVVSTALCYAAPPMPCIVRRDVWHLIRIRG